MTTTAVIVAIVVVAALLAGIALGVRLARRPASTVPEDHAPRKDVDWASLQYVERIRELPEPATDTPSDASATR